MNITIRSLLTIGVLAGGLSGAASAADLPRVLLLGDSISIGYTPYVQKALDGEATVVRPTHPNGKAANCGGTNRGVKSIERWIATDGGDWDVIHFNFGLHDLKRIDPKTGKGSDDPKHPRQAELEVYKKQLTEIVERLEKTGATLIFATTTPVPEGKVSPLRHPADVVKYNNAAREIMKAHDIAIDDLYAFAFDRLDVIQRPANVHFTKEGSKALGDAVAKSIRKTIDSENDEQSNAESRPNILFFLADDMRAGFTAVGGHPFVKTPTLDQLAERGVRFENAFVTTSICAASRATILTGVVERTHEYTFGTPPISNELSAASYPAKLREAGYRTGLIGKFGVGITKPNREKMFDVLISLNRTPYFKPQPDGTTRHVGELIGDAAIDFLRGSAKEPFCLEVCFNIAHAEDNDKANLYPSPRSVAGLYRDIPMPKPPLSDPAVFNALPEFLQESMNRDRWYWQFDTPEKYDKNVRNYFRMISGMDAIIGRVLRELGQLGLAENTIVIFSSDNGYFLGERGFSGKWIHYEESLRVPMIIYDPQARKVAGITPDEMVLNLDIPPTILDYANVTIPEHYQGRSLKPLVHGKSPDDWRTDFFIEHLMHHPDLPKWEGVRTKRYTYAKYFEQNPPYEFLHDRKLDPNQLKNYIDDPEHADVAERLRARTIELRDAYGGEYNREDFPLKSSRRSPERKSSKK